MMTTIRSTRALGKTVVYHHRRAIVPLDDMEMPLQITHNFRGAYFVGSIGATREYFKGTINRAYVHILIIII